MMTPLHRWILICLLAIGYPHETNGYPHDTTTTRVYLHGWEEIYSPCYGLQLVAPTCGTKNSETIEDCEVFGEGSTVWAVSYDIGTRTCTRFCSSTGRPRKYTLRKSSPTSVLLKQKQNQFSVAPWKASKQSVWQKTEGACRKLLEVISLIAMPRPLITTLNIVRFSLNNINFMLDGIGDSSSDWLATVHLVVRDEINRMQAEKMPSRLEDFRKNIKYMMATLGVEFTNTTLSEYLNSGHTADPVLNLSSEQWHLFTQELTTMRESLRNHREDFTLADNHHLALPYYTAYATTHLYLILLSRLVFPEKALHQKFANEFREAAKDHYDYIQLAIGDSLLMTERDRDDIPKELCYTMNIDNKVPRSPGVPLSLRISCNREKLNTMSTTAILARWAGLPDDTSDFELQSADFITLRAASKTNEWFSCEAVDAICSLGQAQQELNPFQFDCEQRSFVDKGQMFKIYSLGKQDGEPVHTCDHVALLYGESSFVYAKPENNWWKSKFVPNSWVPKITKCKMDWVISGTNVCNHNKFVIVVPGKPCGEPILDRDPIALKTDDTQHAMVIAGEHWRINDLSLRRPDNACDQKRTWIVYKYDSPYLEYLHRQRDLRDTNCRHVVDRIIAGNLQNRRTGPKSVNRKIRTWFKKIG